MNQIIYIASLHRPFSQQLKTTKWVCDFISASKVKITSSNLNLIFYYHLIKILHREYRLNRLTEFNGLPSDTSIGSIYSYIQTKTKAEFLKEVPNIIKSRNTPLEKQIYSTYKAASYYVNLAKDKFHLVNEKNQLTINGKTLLIIRSGFFKLSNAEKEFYFKRILEADFHLFLTHCLFAKLEKKYSLKKTIDEQLEFITKFLGLSHFNFTSSSLENYNVVREFWATSLGVININGNIRKKFLEIIEEDEVHKSLFNQLTPLFANFEKVNFRSKKNYLTKKAKFIEVYKTNLKKNVNDLGFVNLHEIKKEMRISSNNFQDFIDSFYEIEKNNLSIFFSNTVNSIDRRERFLIRNRPVIKIKIKRQ